jgi:uncharacterized protein (TIGR03382 family)
LLYDSAQEAGGRKSRALMSSTGRRSVVIVGLLTLASLGLACAATRDQPQFTLSRRPIINGATDTTHTSVVALVYQGEQFCTGTVIAPRWVLSAGHCLVEMASEVGSGFATQSKIFFGTTVGGSGQSIAVTEAHAHPSYYTANDGAPMNDVSVWKLASDAPVTAMPWQQTSLGNPSGKTVQLVGYGVTNANQQTGNGTRREVDGQITQMDSTFIYYGNGYSGTCQGDSGGPMFLNGVVIGVCSFGDQSCVQEGANTRVDVFADFITQYVGSTQSQPAPVTVTVTAPSNGATVSSSFAVTANVTTTAGVNKVEFLIDNATVATLTSAPWTYQAANLAAGSHQITVRGTGSDGGTGQASVQVTVQSTTPTGCSSSNPCPTGYDCVNSQCVVHQPTGGCSTQSPCATGYTCVSGTCVVVTPINPGATGASCAQNAECQSGMCVDGATGSGYCTQACTGDHDCPNNSACWAMGGMSLCGPAYSAIPANPDTGTDRAVTGGCQAGGRPAGPAGALSLLLLALGLVLRRR